MLLAIPLDDRPVNRQALSQLAAVAGLRVTMPPRALLGRFRRAGSADALIDWLGARLPAASGVLLSLDMLCYGGLVASRSTATEEAHALARLDTVERLLARHPVPAFATTVLLRQSTTVSDEASLARWRRLFELMSLPDGARDAALAGETDPAVRDEIRTHLIARRRNHAVNRRAIEMVARGALAQVAILKEDCSPEGVHRLEESELLALRGKLGVAERVHLEPGADEGGMMLLARHALARAKVVPAVRVEYAPARLADTVALYEDRAIGRTVPSQVAVCGLAGRADAALALTVASGAPSGADLFASAPAAHGASAGRDAAWPTAVQTVAHLLHAGASRFAAELHISAAGPAAAAARASAAPRGVAAALRFGTAPGGDRPAPPELWALADVGMANGADPELARELLDSGLARSAAAFAGWNTAANTTGSALAHLAALACPGARGAARRRAQARYLFTRWADDYVYQGVVRREVLDAARAAGANPYDFGKHGRALAALLAERMRVECTRRLARLVRVPLPAPGGPVMLAKAPRVIARFPWNRAFEVEIELEEVECRDA